MAKNTALAKSDAPAFAIATRPTAEIVAIIAENLGGAKITMSDLPRIKVPTGGGLGWTLPSFEGEPEVAGKFRGVIIHSRPARSLFRNGEPDGSPPDCSSDDGDVGRGNPGGTCGDCFFNAFGSKGKDPATTTVAQLRAERGPKGCADKRALFILRDGDLLPTVLVLPVMSVKTYNQLTLGFSSRGRKYDSAVVEFGLEAAKNSGGQPYSKVKFSIVEMLDEDSYKR